MDHTLCKLTLVCPPDGADRIIELMLGLHPPLAGFTTWSAEGHRFGFADSTVGERVRGHVKRTVIVAVVEQATADHLLELIGKEAANPHLVFWMEPVSRLGRMTPVPTLETQQIGGSI